MGRVSRTPEKREKKMVPEEFPEKLRTESRVHEEIRRTEGGRKKPLSHIGALANL